MSTLNIIQQENPFLVWIDEEKNVVYNANGTRPYFSIDDLIKIQRAISNTLAFYKEQNLNQIELDALNHEEAERKLQSFLQKQELKQSNKEKVFVYLMRDRKTKLIKIGYSKNPKQREKSLQVANPEIKLIKHYSAFLSDEKQLHKLFSAKKIVGEWFDLSASDLQQIDVYFEGKERENVKQYN